MTTNKIDILLLLDSEADFQHVRVLNAVKYATDRGLVVQLGTIAEHKKNPKKYKVLIALWPNLNTIPYLEYVLHFQWRIVKYPQAHHPSLLHRKFDLVTDHDGRCVMFNCGPKEVISDKLKFLEKNPERIFRNPPKDILFVEEITVLIFKN